ncbi:MAG: sugar ABC transporter permease [Candidatus Atribacteria bacterium]|nr:sugar ABC transporter permease [Candidatus Atribacteria bacterium]
MPTNGPTAGLKEFPNRSKSKLLFLRILRKDHQLGDFFNRRVFFFKIPNFTTMTENNDSIGAVFQVVLGFSLGLLLNREFRGRNILTSFFLIPVIISPVVVAFMWKMIYSEQYGPINYILNVVFFLNSVPWLSNTTVALFSIIIANSWEWFPLILLVTMGGLQTISDDYVQAAQIDGASGWQITRWIIIPLLAPVLLTITLIRVIEDFKLFDLIYVLTHGGPGMSTETLNYLTYLKGFKFFSFGYSSALSIVQMIVVLGIAAMLVKKILVKD